MTARVSSGTCGAFSSSLGFAETRSPIRLWGLFFGETEKPHKLISNLWWVYGLARDKPSREKFRDRKKTTYTQVVTVDAAGVTHRAITGRPDLKKNEEYTDAFGESFAELSQLQS